MKYSAVDQHNQIEKFELLKDEKIGEGATAFVYKVFYKNQVWAAKLFKDGHQVNTAKLKAMLEHPPSDVSINIDDQEFIQYTWVKYLIKNGTGKIIGFLMPYVDHGETYSLDTFYDPVLSKRLKTSETALSLRIQLAINFCELINNLHRINNFFVDLKPQNIRVYKKNHKVVLLDCDGYSIDNPKGSPNRFDADLISTDYIAPEVTRNNLKPNTLGLQQDLYGIAVILFQLLNRGTHPFQGIITDKNISANTNDERASLKLYPYGLNKNSKVKPRPQSVHNLFLDETRYLFDKSFETESRTTAEEWLNHFKFILNNNKLELCEKIDRSERLEKNLIHIKFTGKDCIGCKLQLENPTPINKNRTYKLDEEEKINNPNLINNSSSPNSKYLPPSKPDKFNFGSFFKFSVISIFILFILVQLSKNPTTSTPITTAQINPTSDQSSQSCSIDLKYSTSKQICNYYWSSEVSNNYTCNIAIAAELRDRGQYHMPKTSCGTAVMTNSSTTSVNGNKSPSSNTAIKDNQSHNSNTPEIGFVSAYTSKNLGVGWSVGSSTKKEAESLAKKQCDSHNDGPCTKWFTERAKCIALAEGATGTLFAAYSNDEDSTSNESLRNCNKDGEINCKLVGKLCQLN